MKNGTSVIKSGYNSQNLLTSKTVPHFSTVVSPPSSTMHYDAYGRLTASIVPSGKDGKTRVTKTISYKLDTNGGNDSTLNQTITEAATSQTPYVQKLSHHIVNGNTKIKTMTIHGENNAITTYIHDVLGNRKSATDPIGIVTSTHKDSLGRTTWINNPATGEISFHYNSKGVLQTKTDAHVDTTYAHDKLGRTLSKTFFDNIKTTFA